MNKNKVFVCNFCGSENVFLNAAAWWNKEEQKFEFDIQDHGSFDLSNGYCKDCDNNAIIVEENR